MIVTADQRDNIKKTVVFLNLSSNS